MEKKKLTKKQLVLRVLFSLTFIPYILVLLSGISGFFSGYYFLSTYNEPGFEAAIENAAFTGFLLCYFPVIPVCLLIQIAVLVNFLIKKKHKKFPTKILVIIVCVISLTVAGLSLYDTYKYDLQEFVQGIEAENMYKEADEIKDFNHHLSYGDYIFNNEHFSHDTFMYDRDTHKVGFVTGGTFDQFESYELKEMSKDYVTKLEERLCEDPILTSCELSNGDYFIVYRGGATYSTLVKLLLIYTKDGQCWGYEFEGDGTYLWFSNGSFND